MTNNKCELNVSKVKTKSDELSKISKKPFIPVRYVIVSLGTIATGLVFCLRVNLSVAIIAMVNNTAINEREALVRNTNDSTITVLDLRTTDQCIPSSTENVNRSSIIEHRHIKEGSLIWNQATQGVVLGAYYYGYSATQIISGRLAEKFGGRFLCGIGTFGAALATLLTPLASQNLALIIIARIAIGVFHGTVYTSLYVMMAFWFPKKEKATALSFITVGGNLGAALTMPLCSFLIEKYNWQSVFYVTGSICFIWLALWMYYARSTPNEHPYISTYELNQIKSDQDFFKSKKNVSAPWKSILTAPTIWAIAAAKSCGMFGYYTLSTKLPAYLESVLNVSIEKNGIINSLTYVAVSISLTLCGPLTDYLKYKYNFSLTLMRKVFETIGKKLR
ncbi:Sialin-like protein [Dinothrombium tinctorium]|uniref:Sialin-like protein n=1 Tax=Dinothrombium tinctorium TaxID=1965070 RepID=A0A3S3P7Y1_9ACAR|nr:Sialin-like protein [Dinothrombium tinctorium]RWS03030.1 Sialin-like protein [Dinothrombium tinctorium]